MEIRKSKVRDVLATKYAIDQRWFLSPKDVAELSGLSESAVRQAIYRGALQALKFRDRRWLIATEDAKRWIASECEPATAA